MPSEICQKKGKEIRQKRRVCRLIGHLIRNITTSKQTQYPVTVIMLIRFISHPNKCAHNMQTANRW